MAFKHPSKYFFGTYGFEQVKKKNIRLSILSSGASFNLIIRVQNKELANRLIEHRASNMEMGGWVWEYQRQTGFSIYANV
jgi:hypothetical protein